MEQERKTLIVAPGSGMFKSIQEAVNAAEPGTRILVSPGLYSRPIKVNKPGLSIESLEENGEVQVTVTRGPILRVNLQDDETLEVRGLRFIHYGEKPYF
jgi:F-box protein 11